MRLFNFFRRNHNLEDEVDFEDNFNDNSNGWVQEDIKHNLLIQKIENNHLHLKSLTDEMGVHSSINLPINENRNFEIEAKIKLSGREDLYYFTLDFGIKRKDSERTNVAGQNIPTSFGQKNYYFGFSNSQEYLVTKWIYGKETYYVRDYSTHINIDGFNILKIQKSNNMMYYYVNGHLLFEHKYKKFFGTGLGFGTAPNANLVVEYVKVKYK